MIGMPIPGKIKKYTQLTSNIKTWRWSYSQSSPVPQPTKSIPSEIDAECTLDLYLLLEPLPYGSGEKEIP